MKKIYITGIAGMLGANIGYLLKDRYKIHGVDKVNFSGKDIECEQFDLLDNNLLRSSLHKFNPDYLIHTAAMVNVDLCEEKQEEAKQLNVELTKQLVNLCNEISCKLIFISSDAVFDGENCSLYNEKDTANPINYYGKTKLTAEQFVLEKNQIVVRTNIYGFNIQNKNSLGEWICESLKKGEKIGMFTDIDFSPILVNELTEILIQLLERGKRGLFHVCGTGCITKYDFGKYIQDCFEIETGEIIKTTSNEKNFKALRSKHMGMSNDKVKNELNITIPTPQESIEDFYRLYLEGYPVKLKKWGGI